MLPILRVLSFDLPPGAWPEDARRVCRAIITCSIRGERQEMIFRNESDRELFLARLSQARARYGWVQAWVLIQIHYHLPVETPEANLVAGVLWFQITCTARFRLLKLPLIGLFRSISDHNKPASGDMWP